MVAILQDVNPAYHKGFELKTACILSFNTKKYTMDTVAINGGTTTGMPRHYHCDYREEYENLKAKKPVLRSNATILSACPTQCKDQFITTHDVKRLFKIAEASWAIEEAGPFRMYLFPTFCKVLKH